MTYLAVVRIRAAALNSGTYRLLSGEPPRPRRRIEVARKWKRLRTYAAR
jgi:hypothetical protein